MERQELAKELLKQASLLLSRSHGPGYTEPLCQCGRTHTHGKCNKCDQKSTKTQRKQNKRSSETVGGASSAGQASSAGPTDKQRALNRAKQTLGNAREALDALTKFGISYQDLADSLGRGITAMDRLIEQNKSTQKASKPNKVSELAMQSSSVKA